MCLKFKIRNLATIMCFHYCKLPNNMRRAYFYLQVEWGEVSMIQAERVLLQNALEDMHNERFVFLSDRFDISF